MKRKTRIFADRLGRFLKADGWAQRRVEEGFAAYDASYECNMYIVLTKPIFK